MIAIMIYFDLSFVNYQPGKNPADFLPEPYYTGHIFIHTLRKDPVL